MDALACRQHHACVRVLPHIKKLEDCFGQFLVRVICDCRACREIEPEVLGCAQSAYQLQVNVMTARSVTGSCTVLIFVTIRLFPRDWQVSLAASAAFS
jgi:hypothetical protein